MAWHIKIGNDQFCVADTPKLNFFEMLNALGHSGMCSHKDKATAEKQVEFLKANGFPEARLCEGFCDRIDD